MEATVVRRTSPSGTVTVTVFRNPVWLTHALTSKRRRRRRRKLGVDGEHNKFIFSHLSPASLFLDRRIGCSNTEELLRDEPNQASIDKCFFFLFTLTRAQILRHSPIHLLYYPNGVLPLRNFN